MPTTVGAKSTVRRGRPRRASSVNRQPSAKSPTSVTNRLNCQDENGGSGDKLRACEGGRTGCSRSSWDPQRRVNTPQTIPRKQNRKHDGRHGCTAAIGGRFVQNCRTIVQQLVNDRPVGERSLDNWRTTVQQTDGARPGFGRRRPNPPRRPSLSGTARTN